MGLNANIAAMLLQYEDLTQDKCILVARIS